MSKRLSDSEVWKKAWFYDLEPKYKLFWFYILSDCDAAGIWPVNMKLAENILKAKYEISTLLSFFKDQIRVLNGGNYWFIIDFIKFQYGYPLSETSPMRKKLNDLLKSKDINIDTLYDNLNTVSIQYTQFVNTVKDKDKDIDKDMDKEENPEFEKWKTAIQENYSQLFKMREPLTFDQHNKLVERWGKKAVKLVYERMHNWPDLAKKNVSANLTARKYLKQDNPGL
jgi:hypothetical protein